GCDSIVILELTVDDIIENNIDQSICSGETFPFGNQDLSVSGTYRDTLQTPSGCDSIVILELTVDDIIENTIPQSICSGETFPFGNQDLSVSGTYRDTLQTPSGCDSIVILELTVDDIIENNIDQSICSGETFPFGNQDLSVSGTYRDTLQTPSGCDSIVILELTVDNLTARILSESNTIGCEFQDLQLTAEINGDFTRILWLKDGVIIDSIQQINVSGIGEYQLLVENGNACMAEDFLEISEGIEGIAINLNIQQPNCEGNGLGNILVDSIVGGMPPFTYALDENPLSTNSNFRNLEAGDYLIKIQDAQGCEWDTTITILPATDLTVNLGDDITLPFGQSVTLEAILNKTNVNNIIWSSSGKDSLSCSDCLEPTVSPIVNTVYQIQVEDEEGCVATDLIAIFVEKVEDFFVPNVFSPNGDSNNDFFYLQTNNSAVTEIESFQIFDRWGHLVFRRNNFLPNDETLGWDGRSQDGALMNPAVFVFTAKVNYIDGSTKRLEGEITLLR
ncbi:MAG: gliding motility-associated C-terminal domain-containing protein, partial [Bacteroidota bacterium]